MADADYDELVARGVELAEEEDYAEAIRVLQQAAALDDGRVDAHYNLGVVYGLLAMSDLDLEDYFEDKVDEEIFLQNALEEYQHVLEIDPNHVAAHNNLATVCALHGDVDQAMRELQLSLDLDPNQPEVREQLEDLEGT